MTMKNGSDVAVAACVCLAMVVTVGVRRAEAVSWTEEARLSASDAAQEDLFGVATSITGTTALVGSYKDDDKGTESGSAYIYEKSGGTWSQVKKLTANDGYQYDYFGLAVCVSETTAIVGAYGDDDKGGKSGSAYIYEKDGTWSFADKVTALDGEGDDRFGRSVYIDGTMAIVGAHGDDSSAGSAYIFEKDGDTWSQIAKLTADDRAASDQFGYAVAIDDKRAVVGAYGHEESGGDATGAAYIFEDNGTDWVQVAKLTATDAEDRDFFGRSICVEDTRVLVGTDYDHHSDAEDAGSAYIFEKSGDTWSEVAKLIASDADDDDHFGIAVSLSGSRALIGAYTDDVDGSTDAGSAYVFQDNGTAWVQVAHLISDNTAAGDRFGRGVGLDGTTALIGADKHDDPATDAGVAYIFTTPIPEPATLLLVGTGTLGILGFIRRRRIG